MFLSILVILSSAFAITPMAPRTPANPYLPNVEFAAVPPLGGCDSNSNCVTVANTGGTFLIPQNGNVPGPVRVLDSDGYTVGVFLDAMPTIVGQSMDETTGLAIPLVQGRFASAMKPCVQSWSPPEVFLLIGKASTLTLGGTAVVFTDESADGIIGFTPDGLPVLANVVGGATQIARVANTGAIVKYYLGYGEIVGAVPTAKHILRDSSGPVYYGNAWKYTIGTGHCGGG